MYMYEDFWVVRCATVVPKSHARENVLAIADPSVSIQRPPKTSRLIRMLYEACKGTRCYSVSVLQKTITVLQFLNWSFTAPHSMTSHIAFINYF